MAFVIGLLLLYVALCLAAVLTAFLLL